MSTEPKDPEPLPLPLPPGFVIGELPKPVYKRRRRKKRAKKPGRPRKYINQSPSKRDGKRSYTVTVEEVVYIHLKELQKFYKLSSLSKTIAKFVEPAFDKVLQDAEILRKINLRKEKEREEDAARVAAYYARKNQL